MGMPVTVNIVDPRVKNHEIESIFSYFKEVDKRFSTYKKNSEISRLNRKEIFPAEFSKDLKEILKLSEHTKEQTSGYFDVTRNGIIDPSGIVKGWAINNSANLIREMGYRNFFVDIGGDIQTSGINEEGKKWRVGMKNPFKEDEIVRVVELSGEGIATSGSYIRGSHIYDPVGNSPLNFIVSLTVIGPNVYEADRFATAAFVMQNEGLNFIVKKGLEGYMINSSGIATFTKGFNKFVIDENN